jgi:hypothetical protein
MPSSPGATGRRGARSGQVLVEFAVIALLLYLLLAATLELGRALHGAQTIQQAADLLARELSRTPLPPASSFADALNAAAVRQRVYDERLLVIDLDTVQNPNLDVLFASFPVVNQQLRSAMIYEEVQDRRLLRYPGALVTPGNEAGLPPLPDGFQDSGLRVAVPVVQGRDADGVETVLWVSVVEEVTPGAFSLASGLSQSGMAAVRLNYPFQAAALSGFRQSPDGPFEPNGTRRIQAHDAAVTEMNTPPGGGTPVAPADPDVGADRGLNPYGGRYGLGYQLAFAERLRPFRKLLSAQAVYRRELFGS